MPKKETTINDLAIMVQKGFIGVDKRIDGIENKMATKIDMDRRFEAVDKRFDKIEKLLSLEYRYRIEKLEDEMLELKKMFSTS